MNPDIEKHLQVFLEEREKQKQAGLAQSTEKRNAEAQNVSDYKDKNEAVIKPAFKEIVDLYQARGVTLRIIEEDEAPDRSRGGFSDPNVRLDMAGAYPQRSDMKPEFRLSFEKRNRTLSLYTSTGTQAGPAGGVSLDSITADWIHTNFLKYQIGRSFI
jgi:hypothetical protein